MSFDLALPIYAASAIALVAVATYVGRPRFRMRTFRKTFGNLRVIEVAFILSRARRASRVREPAMAARSPAAEFVIYLTLKTDRRPDGARSA
jgi:hypothetical protein